AAEVPLKPVVPLASDAVIPTPGAPMNTAGPVFEPPATPSFWSVPPTPTTLASPAGDCGSLVPPLPAGPAAPRPRDPGLLMAFWRALLKPGPLKAITTTSAPWLIA